MHAWTAGPGRSQTLTLWRVPEKLGGAVLAGKVVVVAKSFRKAQQLEPTDILVLEKVGEAARVEPRVSALAERAPTRFHELKRLFETLGGGSDFKSEKAGSFVLTPAVPWVEKRGFLTGGNIEEHYPCPGPDAESNGYLQARGVPGWVFVGVVLTNLRAGSSHIVELRVGGRGGTIRVRFEDGSEQTVPGGDRTIPVVLHQVAAERVQLEVVWEHCEGSWRFYDARITALPEPQQGGAAKTSRIPRKGDSSELLVFKGVTAAKPQGIEGVRRDRVPAPFQEIAHILEALGRGQRPLGPLAPGASFMLSPSKPWVENLGYIHAHRINWYIAERGAAAVPGATNGVSFGLNDVIEPNRGWVQPDMHWYLHLLELLPGHSYLIQLRVGGDGGTFQVHTPDGAQLVVPVSDQQTIPVLLHRVTGKEATVVLACWNCPGYFHFFDAKITALGPP